MIPFLPRIIIGELILGDVSTLRPTGVERAAGSGELSGRKRQLVGHESDGRGEAGRPEDGAVPRARHDELIDAIGSDLMSFLQLSFVLGLNALGVENRS